MMIPLKRAHYVVIVGTLQLAMLPVGCSNEAPEPDAAVQLDAFIEPDAAVQLDAFNAPDAFEVSVDAPFDAGPPDAAGPPCTMEGEMRSRSCSCMAFRVETCVAGSWRTTEPCQSPLGPGFYNCEPGETRPYENLYCAIGTQLCNEGCQWDAVTYERPPSECPMGLTCANGCVCRDDCTCPALRDGVCF